MDAMIVGVLLLVARLADFGPFAAWSWWLILAPFGVATLWWQSSDSTAIIRRREIDRTEQRKTHRRANSMEAPGLDPHRGRQVRMSREAARHCSRANDTRGRERRAGVAQGRAAPLATP